MLEAKLKQLQDDVEAGRLVSPAAAAAAAGALAMTPMSVGGSEGGGAGEEGSMFDRMKRYMQQIPGTSPMRENGSTPSAAASGERHLPAPSFPAAAAAAA